MVVLAFVFYEIHRHYTGVDRGLYIPEDLVVGPAPTGRQSVLVPVETINRATLQTIDYAHTISPNVTALHVTDEPEEGQELRSAWESRVLDVPLVVIDSPYRSFVAPVLSYIDALDRADPGQFVTVVLPDFVTVWPWQRWLHNQSARRLRSALRERPNTVLVDVPYHLRDAAAADGRAGGASA